MSFDENIDQEMADKGAAAFKQKCTACHKPNAKLIGPGMNGIYERRSPEWVMNILLNPTEMLKKILLPLHYSKSTITFRC